MDRYVELRRQGQSKLVLLDILDAEIFSGDSPAYRAMEALTSVWQQEGMEGHKGAPRVVLALSLLLSEMGKRPSKEASCAETFPEANPTEYRHGLVLAATWRLLTELFRRHGFWARTALDAVPPLGAPDSVNSSCWSTRGLAISCYPNSAA